MLRDLLLRRASYGGQTSWAEFLTERDGVCYGLEHEHGQVDHIAEGLLLSQHRPGAEAGRRIHSEALHGHHSNQKFDEQKLANRAQCREVVAKESVGFKERSYSNAERCQPPKPHGHPNCNQTRDGASAVL